MPGVPLLANMTEFGKTPFFTAAEFEAMGYKMVIWPVCALRVANKAQERALRRDPPRRRHAQRMIDRMQTRAELYATIGLHDYEALDALDRAVGRAGLERLSRRVEDRPSRPYRTRFGHESQRPGGMLRGVAVSD